MEKDIDLKSAARRTGRELVEVVRCKDCEFNSASPHNPLCKKDCNAHDPYWYCADGRKEEKE